MGEAPGYGHGLGHSLAFLALQSFLLAFFLARLFTTLEPNAVVLSGGIHFHHFWYGLAMVVAAGWLGIVSNTPQLDRVYAIVFGFGGGLIGDEVGLLLTLGDYKSELTYVFVIGVVCFACLGILVFGYRGRLEKDLAIGRGERISHIGIYAVGFSAILFAFEYWLLGAPFAAAGVALVVLGLWEHRRRVRPS